MHKKALPIIAAVLIISSVTATTIIILYPYDPYNPPHLDDTGSTSLGIQEVVDAINQFALDLYSKIDETENSNMFYSPYSIFSALVMTYEGAKGQTAIEMESVFNLPEKSVLRPNFAALYNSINQRGTSYELRTGNALWCQNDFPFQEDYIDTIGTYYGGKVSNMDFVNEAEKSRQTINNFISDQTNGLIEDLIPPGALNELTKLVLTNAIYFKGQWVFEFDKSDTSEKDFTIAPENVVKTQMMHLTPEDEMFNYVGLEDLQILELPYKGDNISMLILLPTTDLGVVESTLTPEKLMEYKNNMHSTSLGDIFLPKFEFETKYHLKEALSSLGMPTAFGGDADFSGMSLSGQLQISNAIHQAYIKVDEEGTEAAAATGVIITTTSVPPPPPVFNADHPFLFIIQEQETGNILFMGRVTDPTA